MQALVIGGTGPTGPHIIGGLIERGYAVTILNRGHHDRRDIAPLAERLIADPYDSESLLAALADRRFDLCISMYGRLRMIAQALRDRVGRFISIGGAPAYRGYMNPFLYAGGPAIPLQESAELVRSEAEDSKGWRIVRTERAVFETIPGATHFRYPIIYGPYQPVPREWSFVRRFRDGRRRIILPDGGLTLHSFGFAENVAHGILLAVDQAAASAGKIYNICDVETLTLAQVAQAIADHMQVEFEVVNMPYELAPVTRPLVMQPATTHRVQDTAALRRDLGYTDLVPPREALARTTDWLLANSPQAGGIEEQVLEDPFDYAAEDALIAAWQRVLDAFPRPAMAVEPGVGMAYSGPGGRARTQQIFES